MSVFASLKKFCAEFVLWHFLNINRVQDVTVRSSISMHRKLFVEL